MFDTRKTTLALASAFLPALNIAAASTDCPWELISSPNPSPTLNVFTASEGDGQALHGLLIGQGSPAPYVFRREADGWTDLGGPGQGDLDGPGSYISIHAGEDGRVWIGGATEYDSAIQTRPLITEYDGGWLAPQAVDMINQLQYPFEERGGRVYAMDTAPDGTMFAVGIAKGYGYINDDGSVPLLLINNGAGWYEVIDVDTDWPGGIDPDTYFSDVIAFASDNVWAVGQHAAQDGAYGRGGLIVHWDGSSFTIVEDPRYGGAFLDYPLQAMDANGPDDIWAVGGSFSNPVTSTIAHYNGVSWTRMESPLSRPLHSLALDDDGTAWASPVNFGSDVAYFDGVQWSAMEPPVSYASITTISRDVEGAIWMLGSTTDSESLALTLQCTVAADVNGDNVVDIDDLFAVLAAWGDCSSCAEDINQDGVVDINDVFAVLAAWGP